MPKRINQARIDSLVKNLELLLQIFQTEDKIKLVTDVICQLKEGQRFEDILQFYGEATRAELREMAGDTMTREEFFASRDRAADRALLQVFGVDILESALASYLERDSDYLRLSARERAEHFTDVSQALARLEAGFSINQLLDFAPGYFPTFLAKTARWHMNSLEAAHNRMSSLVDVSGAMLAQGGVIPGFDSIMSTIMNGWRDNHNQRHASGTAAEPPGRVQRPVDKMEEAAQKPKSDDQLGLSRRRISR